MTTKTFPTYDFSMAEEVGTVAAKNFVSLFNPLGSGRLMILGGIFTSCSAFASSLVPLTLRGYRITAASGGTLEDAADIMKFDPANHPDPASEVRTGNPTVTLGPALLNHPVPVDKRAGSVTQTLGFPSAPAKFYPGQGFVMRMEAGTTELFWNISLVWAET